MAELWRRRPRPVTVEHTVVPHEPSAAERAIARAVVLARVDAALAFERTLQVRDWPMIDALLDARLAGVQPLPLRPSVPVIPGRTT